MTLYKLPLYLLRTLYLSCIWQSLNYWGLVEALLYPFFWVKEKVKRQKKHLRSAFMASLIFGVIGGIAIILFMNPLLMILGSRSETYQYSKDYLFYIAVGAPFILLANTFGHAVRGEGASKASMIGGMIGTIVNIILDPIFILSFIWELRGLR